MWAVLKVARALVGHRHDQENANRKKIKEEGIH